MIAPIWFAVTTSAEVIIRINIPSCTLTLLENDRNVAVFPVRVGKPETPTPAGKGKIIKKRERIVFRYLEGERKGEIITQSHLTPIGQTIDMPYDRLRSLEALLNNGQTLIIHSTTEYWTIGFPVSHQCVGMNIDDMLKLFDRVRDLPMDLEITYDTVEVRNGFIHLYPDFYGQATNRLEALTTSGVCVQDRISAENRCRIIDQDLRYNLAKALKQLNEGHDPRALLPTLTTAIAVADFLKPFYPKGRVVEATVMERDTFVAALLRAGVPLKLATAITGVLDGIDYHRLQPGDNMIIVVENREIIRLDYRNRKGITTFDLQGKNLFWD
ncbi:MAG: L,D-transpeptidase [Kiritimatiellae bacterium]|nr:L,D-transpeptidase [Kiritimatiellia bacterium]MDD5523098.1 L,D-transpeptidase [Kiritimatiellia bacterium]